MRFRLVSAWLPFVVASAFACSKEEPKKDPSTVSSASRSKEFREGWKPSFNDNLPEFAEQPSATASATEAPVASSSAVASTSGSAASLPPASPAGSKPSKPTAGGPSEGKITVISNGADPRKRVRYKWSAGKKESMVFEVRMSQRAESADEKPAEQALPAIKFEAELDPKSVSEAGEVRFQIRLVKADIASDGNASPQIAALSRQFAGLSGITGDVLLDSRGIARDAKFNLPEQQQHPIVAIVMQHFTLTPKFLTTPFPETEIGVGAKWERVVNETVPAQQGITVSLMQKEVFTLKELSGDVGTVEVAVTQTQTVSEAAGKGAQAGMGGGKQTTQGTTKSTFDLARLVPKEEFHSVGTAMVPGPSGAGVKLVTKTDARLEGKLAQ